MNIGQIILFAWIGSAVIIHCLLVRSPKIAVLAKQNAFKWFIIGTPIMLVLAFVLWHGPLKNLFGCILIMGIMNLNAWERTRFCPNCGAVNYIINRPWLVWFRGADYAKRFPSTMSCTRCYALIALDDKTLTLMPPRIDKKNS